MKNDFKYDLLIIGGGISACVFASKYLKNNITKKVALIEIGRGLGGRSSTRISKKYQGGSMWYGSSNGTQGGENGHQPFLWVIVRIVLRVRLNGILERSSEPIKKGTDPFRPIPFKWGLRIV